VTQEDWSRDSANDIVPTYQNLTSKKKATNFARGEESSIAHFYRALDDIATKIRNKTIAEALKQGLMNADNDGELDNKSGRKWYPNAATVAGARNEYGQDTLERLSTGRMRKPARFRANIGVSNIHRENQKEMKGTNKCWKEIYQMFIGQLTTKQKFIIGMVLSVYVLFCIVWFTFGCYGLYRWFIAYPVPSIPIVPPTPTSNEYIIRIVQETTTLPKEALMDTVTKAIEDRVVAHNLDLIDNIAPSLADKEL